MLEWCSFCFWMTLKAPIGVEWPRMPVETGSRGFMLQMGRPRTEFICPYGHGTLKQEEFQTSGLENPEWTSHSGDMWEELYAASKQARDEE